MPNGLDYCKNHASWVQGNKQKEPNINKLLGMTGTASKIVACFLQASIMGVAKQAFYLVWETAFSKASNLERCQHIRLRTNCNTNIM